MAIDTSQYLHKLSLSEKTKEQYMIEYENWDKFSDIRGTIFGNAIITKRITKGNVIQVPMLALDYDAEVKTGKEQLKGTGFEPTYTDFEMRVSKNRFARAIEEDDYKSLVFDRDFKSDLRNLLIGQAGQMTFKRTFQALLAGLFYQSIDPYLTKDIDMAARIFSYTELIAKIKLCGLNTFPLATAANPFPSATSTQRIVFGNDFGINAQGAPVNASIGATIVNAGFTEALGHGPNLEHFLIMNDLSSVGSRLSANNPDSHESPVRPISENTGDFGFINETRICLIARAVYNYLRKDPEWKAQTTRGVIEDSKRQPSIFRAGAYKGMIDGIMFIVDPELDKYSLDGGTTFVSIMLGANAMMYAKTDARITVEKDDHDNLFELGHTEISGMRPFMFPSRSDPAQRRNNPLLVPTGIVYGISKVR